MKRKLLLIIFLIGLMIASSFAILVRADPKNIVTRRQTSTSGHVWYTQTILVLGGANDTIRIPDNWNGGLVMLCRGYQTESSLAGPIARFDPNKIPLDPWTWFLDMGYATAASNYGCGGYIVEEGILRTHQLTEYVIDNYHVTGKVYVSGISMGGNIALQLGSRFSDLYSGVLELCGNKNLFEQYADKTYYASLPSDADLAAAVLARGGVVPPYPSPTIPSFRTFCQYSYADIVASCGGTPIEKPQFYERFSPLCSCADISIPTITLHGTADALVPFSQSVDLKNAIMANGDIDLYRLYKVTGAQHGNPDLTNQIPNTFNLLVNWVEHGVLPPPSTA